MINWKLLLAGLLGPLSLAALTMDDLISQVEQQAAMMSGKAFRERQHMPGLLQYISNMFAQYFSTCSNRSLSMAPPTIDTTFISQKLGAQDSFKAPMDQIVRDAMDRGSKKPSPTNKQKDKNKHRDKDDGSPRKPANKKSRNGGGAGRQDPADNAHKTDPSHPGFNRWYDGLLACNQSQFGKLLQHQREAPKFNGTEHAVCLNFHIHGGCKSGKECARAKSHAKPSPDFATQFKAWRDVTIA
jgi:hypothetical protein